MEHIKGHGFPPFLLTKQVLKKVLTEQVTLVLITPALQTQQWCPQLLQMSKNLSFFCPKSQFVWQVKKKRFILSAKGNLEILAPTVSVKSYIQKSFQRTIFLSLILDSRKWGTNFHYKSSWRKYYNWYSWRKFDPINFPVKNILEFLTECFQEGYEYRESILLIVNMLMGCQ